MVQPAIRAGIKTVGGIFVYIKGKVKLNTYKYMVMFDLASKITGVCLWDLQNQKPIRTEVIKIDTSVGLPVASLYDALDKYFDAIGQIVDLDDVLVYKEAMPTQLRGGSSTVQTFIALARSHAILDLYLDRHNMDSYDVTGIYPASTHAYFKHLKGLGAADKVDKQMVNEYVCERYGLKNPTLDESDAVFLAETFVKSKWNRDIDELVREVKRHKKTLKAAHAIDECDNKIKLLLALKN